MIQGLEQLQRKMKDLPVRVQKKISRKALSRGGTVLVKAIRSETPKGKTKAAAKEIGKKIKTVNGQAVMKVGAGLGSKTKKSKQSEPHSHLLILGTQPRYTGQRSWKTKGGRTTRKTGNKKAFRGQMKPDPIVKRGAAKGSQAAAAEVKRVMAEEIAKEAAK